MLQRYNIFSIIIILDNKKVHELHELSRIKFFQKKYKKPLTPPSFIYIAADKLNKQQITQKKSQYPNISIVLKALAQNKIAPQ